MKKIIAVTFLLITLSAGAQKVKKQSAVIKELELQTQVLLQAIPVAREGKADLVSPRTVEQGRLKLVSSRDWTSGFFSGELWYLYELTGKPQWRLEAANYTASLEREKVNGDSHDIGFKIFCSFGNGYRLTKDPHYKEVIIQAAKTLSTRFNPVAGVIKSWDNRKEWGYPVIIDNMMNLELLFEASKISGDTSFYHIAFTHAMTTLCNHFREDNSSYHVLNYDTTNGKVLQKTTHQGYSSESAWARGQAWGLYGFTMCYRETKNPLFLEQAQRIAKFLLSHPDLPNDGVPYWDFNAPNLKYEPRDASAAAIMCSALYELSTYSQNKNQYRSMADKILHSLSTAYRSPVGENKGFLLLHSTGHKPAKSEIDVPITYADYYFVEALLRRNKVTR